MNREPTKFYSPLNRNVHVMFALVKYVHDCNVKKKWAGLIPVGIYEYTQRLTTDCFSDAVYLLPFM